MKVEFELERDEVEELVRRELTEQIQSLLSNLQDFGVDQRDIVTLSALKHVLDYYTIVNKEEGKN